MTIKSIGATGRDYSTLASWIAACPANLVTGADTWEGEMYADAEFTGVAPLCNITGITTDSTHNVQLRTGASQSFFDNANKTTNALKYNASNGVGVRTTSGSDWVLIVNNCDYTTVTGIQFKDGQAQGCCKQTGTSPHTVFTDCIMVSGGGASGSGVLNQNGSTAINCLIEQTAAGAVGSISNGNSSKYYNCTVVNTAASASVKGIRRNYDTPIVKNCISMNFGTDFDGSMTQSYNISKDTTASGTGSLTSKTFANQFVSVTAGTEDFRIKAGADVINAGTRDATDTSDLDIIKQSRSTTTPTIGAWEYIAAGAASKLFMIGSLNGLGSGGPFFHNGDR